MMKKNIFLCLTLIGTSMVYSSELTIPNQFSDGQVTSASQMNENFAAIQAAVNDLNSRIESASSSNTSNTSSYQPVFQGFTQGTVDGRAGLFEMQRQCNNFVSGSKICTASDIADSPYNQAAMDSFGGSNEQSVANAWISNHYPLFSDRDVHLGGGEYDGTRRLCKLWASNSSDEYGPTVNSFGDFREMSCSLQLHVACCK